MLKTNQLVLRKFYNKEIRQRTQDSYFNATDLLNIYNKDNNDKKLMNNFLRSNPVKEFMEALADELNSQPKYALKRILPNDLYSTKKGVNGGTWMHPYLFLKFAMWINPKFEVQVIKWIYDNLILFRHEAGDYFKEMMNSLQKRLLKDGINGNPLVYSREINFINSLVFGSMSINQRKRASEDQLKKISMLQKANMKLLDMGLDRPTRWERLRDLSEVI